MNIERTIEAIVERRDCGLHPRWRIALSPAQSAGRSRTKLCSS